MSIQIPNLNDLLQGQINGAIVEQKVTRLTAPGENYGSLMLKVDVTVDNGKVLHTVAKCVPPNKEMFEIFNVPVTFKNEAGWYMEAIPALQQFQREQEVKEDDFYMKVYGCRLSLHKGSDVVDEDAVILCENLKEKGFINVDRRKGFSLVESKEVIKKLAFFHASTIALKLKKPEVFQQKVAKYLRSAPENINHDIDLFNKAFEIIRNNPDTASLEPFVRKTMEVLPTTSSDSLWQTAIHNDFWCNNIMIQNDVCPPQVIILDLQMCQLGSAVTDLLFFLGTSIENGVMKNHMDELIQLYYDSFVQRLQSMKVDTNMFSHEHFLRELNNEGPNQFAHAMFFVAITLNSQEKAEDATSTEYDAKKGLARMFQNVTPEHKEKYVLLAKKFAEHSWLIN